MTKARKAALIGGGVAALAGLATLFAKRREDAVETPDCAIIERDGDIEVRDYPALVVAETQDYGARGPAMRHGFRRLADYIFAKKRGPGADDDAISMTAPVLADRTESKRWRTRFVMPAGRDRASLPAPDGGVATTELPARRMAALRFRGSAGDTTLADHERRLRAWLAQHGYDAAGPAEYAFYNSPMVAPPLRRNEVLVPVAR